MIAQEERHRHPQERDRPEACLVPPAVGGITDHGDANPGGGGGERALAHAGVTSDVVGHHHHHVRGGRCLDLLLPGVGWGERTRTVQLDTDLQIRARDDHGRHQRS